ncbi:transposase [Clostridium estertheticum]|nr:transposase [Clostridium estertheticum]
MTLTTNEFISRFIMYILQSGFNKIRHVLEMEAVKRGIVV